MTASLSGGAAGSSPVRHRRTGGGWPAILAATGLIWAAAASAQETPPAAAPPATSPEATPEKVDPAMPAPNGNLSQQLDQSKGVIAPKASQTDPALVKVPPDQGAAATPVIPPPGTPGINPDVQPK